MHPEYRSMAICASAVLLLALICSFFPYVFCGLSGVGYIGFVLFDFVFSGRLIPSLPWIGWALVGALLGAALGFWTIAPAYGLRQARRTILVVPAVIVFTLMCLTFARPLPPKATGPAVAPSSQGVQPQTQPSTPTAVNSQSAPAAGLAGNP